MCHLKQFDQNATAAGSGPPLDTGDSPVSSVTGPTSTPGPPVFKDTKLAKLLKVVVPIIQGGAVGATSGNWRVPGSGGEAAQNFFSTQIAQNLAKRRIDLEAQQHASQEALRQSTEKRNQFYDQYLRSRIQHEDYLEQHPKPEAEHVTELSGYPGTGLYTSGPKAGQTYQMTRPVATNPDGTQKDYSNIGASGPVPLGPSVQEKQQEEREAERKQKEEEPQSELVTNADDTGATSSSIIDKNPRSKTFGQTLKGGVAHRSAKGPDKGDVETYAQAALQAAANDPDKALTVVDGLKKMPPEMKQYVRARIREMAKPGKPKKSSSVDDAIAAALAKRNQQPGVPATP